MQNYNFNANLIYYIERPNNFVSNTYICKRGRGNILIIISKISEQNKNLMAI